MSGPVYCILSGGAVHCVPVAAFSHTNDETLDKLARSPHISLAPALAHTLPPLSPASLAIKRKNLLYTLNNPSLSDLESDVSRAMLTGLPSQDEDEHVIDASFLRVPDGNLRAGLAHAENGIFHQKNLASAGLANVDASRIIDIGTRFSGDADDEYTAATLAILHDYSTHAVYLPQYSVDLKENLDSDYTQIKTLLTKIFPAWNGPIAIKQLTGGITNMLLSCCHEESQQTLLMRVYGQGTNLIIDRNREFVSHLVLNSLELAPAVHARFANGLIYGYLPGRSLHPSELSDTRFFPLIAQQLGNWHNSINCEYIEDGVTTIRKYSASLKTHAQARLEIRHKHANGEAKERPKKSVNNIWDLIEEWIQIVPPNEALAGVFDENSALQTVTQENVRDVVMQEFKWLKKTLRLETKSPVVVSHCDLLSGNIIIPSPEKCAEKCLSGKLPPLEENPIQFIDYEYMLPAPRAFDIANHFAEWQGFDCNRDAIPEPSSTNPVMVSWCKGYLNDAEASQDQVDGLIDEIACYYGMPGFYWGIWAMIQSELSTIDFNYAEYGKLRLEEYWLWKKQFLSLRTSSQDE